MFKTDATENLPPCPTDHRPPVQASSLQSRDPLISILDPTQISNGTADITPTKPNGRAAEAMHHFRTPEKQGNGAIPKNRFGWSTTESRNDMPNYMCQSSRNGGSLNTTPRTTRAATGSRPSQTETTPTKSVSKPSNSGFAPMSTCRVPGSYSRNGNYAALSKGLPVSNGMPSVVNTLKVPHFDLKEDPSFWIHHNVQVIIRVRPLNSAERGVQGYNRCVKQESSQNITWIGQPESRFAFDHVACETVDQEMLFRKAGLPMVENCLSGYNSCMFAYGQTGSGKTFTMVGDIEDLEFMPSFHRGMTPRIFEYLFARIRAEEESRRDDQLKYSCKCSFLEIYNEQITDLLNPSATNLLLREDMRKGIYVENLSEFEVYSVGDILKLLAQGSLNRKVAATNMNMESSRSHSVFTCVIESKWERESTTNLRFARLNLVDLAGSERQKTSGAEGERLKEAANINKSLSTLGHVIMVLVDVANGKTRHVPYRDSKLTFLLQDSLGGNSKTIIIANISPSTSCAAETLNTLKFAQRAKLIQNNAIVNEDSSGDVSALQHQIQILKEELSALKRQPVSRSLLFGSQSLQYNTEDHDDVDMEIDQPLSEESVQYEAEATKISSQQLKSLENIVAGALRREHTAETSIKKLEAQIEHLNRLVHQREKDAKCSKMQLKFREDKIRRMESFLKGEKTVDSYLLEENASLSEEIQMLQEKVDKNPEVTRFAAENIRLSEDLKRFQDFYEEGEREILLSEVSELRDKLIQHYDENTKHSMLSNIPMAPKKSTVPEEKEKCEGLLKPAEEILNLELELDILKIILKEERSSRVKADELTTCLSRELKLAEESILSSHKQYEDVNEQLEEAKSKIESLQSKHMLSVNELEDLKQKNKQYAELLRKKELEFEALKQRTCRESNDCLAFNGSKHDENLFQLRIDSMQASLEKAKILNASYQRDHVFQKANEEETDTIRQQVEEETAQVILCLQDELSALEQQVQDSYWKEKERLKDLNALTCENEALREQIKEKEKDADLITREWELLSNEIEGALDCICSYVPQKGKWVSEQVHRLIKQASEKELVIEDLNACLENANARLNDMESKLRTLRGAALVITESHQKESSEKEKEIHTLRSELSAKSAANVEMMSKIDVTCDEMRKTSKCATVAFVIVSRLSELNTGHLEAFKHIELQLKEAERSNQMKEVSLDKYVAAFEEAASEVESLRKELQSTELQLKESIESNKIKEVSLDKFVASFEEAASEVESLRKELQSTEENCHWLGNELAKQQAYIAVTEKQLEEYHDLDILKTREKLSELQEGVSTMKAFMNTNQLHKSNENMQISELWLDDAESRESHVCNNSVGYPADDESSVTMESCADNFIYEDVKANEKSCKTGKGGISKDATVTLLRKEIESALESLKAVQDEVNHLNAEKKRLNISERQSREGMGMVKAQILQILDTVGEFEDQCLHKIKILNQKVEQLEQHAEEASCYWGQVKEIYESELNNATAEASCLLSKFEEAQGVMKEADVMIKGLMIANETLKLEMEDLKRVNLSLDCERDGLIQEIQDLHSYAAVDNYQCHELLQELEIAISQAQGTSEEAFLSMSADISSLKSQVLDSRQLIKSWLEDLWSEIFVKDSVSSVLHLCHMGVLLEVVTKVTAENFLLNNRLCESDAVITHMREQNIKSVQEIEAFSLIKEKLLADIKKSFDLVTRKENETAELSAKLRRFESKITDLQLQEEFLLERSNYLGFELDELVKDLNYRNSDAVASLVEQEKLLNDNKEATISQEENFMRELSAKDLELVIVTSELQHLADENFLLNDRLCESDAVITHMREQKIKSVQELEAFSLLKEKLLADIKKSFDHVTSKENETAELGAKFRRFESKLTDLQLQEELLLERSNYLGLELDELVKDLNDCNSDAVASLLEQEKFLNENKEATISQEENFMRELSAKDLELVVVTSELQHLADEKADIETNQMECYIAMEHLKEEFICLTFISNLMQQLMFERDDEVIHLKKEVGEANLQLTQTCTDIISLDVLNTVLREELVLQKNQMTFLNEKFNSELHEASEYIAKLSESLQRLENEHSNVTDKLKTMEGEFQLSCGHMSVLDQQNKDLENELKLKDGELGKMKFLEQEYHSLKEELNEVKKQNSGLFMDVQVKDSEVASCQDQINILVSEKFSLQESMHDMESKISFLQEELDLRMDNLNELQCSHTSANEKLSQKSEELQNHVMKMNMLEEENMSLKNELSLLQLSKFEDFSMRSSSIAKCLNLIKSAEMESYRMCALFDEKIDIVSDRLCQDICRNLEAVVRIEDTLQPLDILVEDVTSETSSLQAELLRKDEILKGLSFDLSLLQESASSSKDQKDQIEELKSSLNMMEDELKAKSQECDDAVAEIHDLEARMKEKIDNISLLERDLSAASVAKVHLESKLDEKNKHIESLEIELVDMGNSIDQANASIESLKSDLKEVISDRDHLHEEIQDLEEKLDTAQALAEEYEEISMEAKQIAESNRIYGEEKEEEVKLLEISVQEVDRTVYALENKVHILQEDAERQRLQREELEIELNSLKDQIYNLETADSDIQRHLEEKEQNLQKALSLVEELEKDLANKEAEISRCKGHITELNLHAEAQASEYKKKFKALEAMAGQVKNEGPSSHNKSSSSNKVEKNSSKPRGSGSPFKCIGIGLTQQLKLEKDEDLTAERLRIQELEALAAVRQKEIFVLNNRLASAESMTHDVIRDLLGLKMDMTNYVSFLDKQQVQKKVGSDTLENGDSEVKLEETHKLNKLLSDFVEERKRWLEEIDRRQAELVAAQLALEQLHQKDRLLTAENEALMVDVEKYKKRVLELEGQQNLHQRIHHHEKIKDENNNLKQQIEELSARLQRADSIVMEFKEMIPEFRRSKRKLHKQEIRPSNRLKEAEEERVKLAQELLGLCTSILKAAGIKKAPSDISVATAKEALEQLGSKFTSLERELENFKLKSGIENERLRLSEVIMKSPPQPVRRTSHSPFFSAVDR